MSQQNKVVTTVPSFPPPYLPSFSCLDGIAILVHYLGYVNHCVDSKFNCLYKNVQSYVFKVSENFIYWINKVVYLVIAEKILDYCNKIIASTNFNLVHNCNKIVVFN